MRPITTLTLLAGLLSAAACSDYDLKTDADETGGPGDTNAPADTELPEDTSSLEETVTPQDTDAPEDTDLPPGAATEPIYLNTGSTLYSYEPDTNTLASIGDFREGPSAVTDMTDVAIDLSGRMYGVSFDTLYSVDATNAEVTRIGPLGLTAVNGLTFVSDGTLIATAGTQVLVVDADTAAVSVLADTPYYSSGDIVGLPDGYLYWSVDGGVTDDIVQVDPDTGSWFRLGDTGETSLYALGYAYGDLWAFNASGEGHVLDPSNAASTRTVSVPGVWYGATTNPVLW